MSRNTLDEGPVMMVVWSLSDRVKSKTRAAYPSDMSCFIGVFSFSETYKFTS